MKKIKLTKGLFSLIDDEDFDYLNQWKWYTAVKKPNAKKLYACHDFKREPEIINKFGSRHITMHRFLLNPSKNLQVDHINGNGLDNRRKNLRLCTQTQNNQNFSVLKITNKSGYKGVCWDKRRNKWRANIKINKKQTYLGQFKTSLDAAKAYNEAALKYFGEFAYLNKIS